MQQKLTYIMVLLLLLSSCKEYEPTELEPSNQPEFWVNGSNGASSIHLVANGQYRVNSGSETDSLDIVYYYAELVADACQSCKEKFILRWRADAESNPDLDALVSISNPEYRFINAKDSLTSYSIELNAQKYGLNGNVTWQILGTTYTGDQVTIELDEEEGLSKIPVVISADYDGCSSSLTDTIYLPNHGCDCKIDAFIENPNKVVYNALPSGGSGYGYSWRFKDANVSASSQEVSYYYTTLPSNGVERAEVTVNTRNCAATRVRNVVIDSNATSCSIHFDYSIEEVITLVPANPEIDLTELEVEYTDSEGSVYRSFWIEQSSDARFEVLDEEDYSDPNFQATKRSKKITAEFRCLLSNGSETIEITDGELVLPIGLGAD